MVSMVGEKRASYDLYINRRELIDKISLATLGRDVRKHDKPPTRKRSCLRPRGVGVLTSAFTLLVSGRTPSGEMVWPIEPASVLPLFSRGGRKLKL